MKIKYLISIMIMIEFITLFFFPKPETNFRYYFGTALVFTAIIFYLIIKRRKINK